MKKILLLICIQPFIGLLLSAQPNVYPTHWWVGMKNHHLQLMVHGNVLPAKELITMSPYPGVKLVKISRVKNPNYLFIDLDISADAKPGTIDFRAPVAIGHILGSESVWFHYELLSRSKENGKSRIKGINSSDLIYLIMPDRFSNGDPSNDRIAGMKDQSLDRSNYSLRHGGDLKGIENHLDYLQDLGVTALWLNPVVVNDMPNRTEHGYACTDHYVIDPRIGGPTAYHALIDDLHKRGMKIIQDAVYNHIGIEHFLYRDLPDSSWFHFWPTYTNTTFKDQVLLDPYASASDKKRMSDGWFSHNMPDVNQNNPYFANYLIQNAIWCTEEFGLDGWRIDTYAYNDLNFMNRCNKALLDEYPQLHLFGETWVHGIPDQSFFTQNVYNIPYKSNLPGVTDFQLNMYGIIPALTQKFGWTEGVNRLYLTATNDYVYKDPMKNVIFLDNHDMSRFYSVVGEDTMKLKVGLTWLLTFRGIPEMYYGTEVLMAGTSNPDGKVRLDFPGGWPGDNPNKFEASGRSEKENEVFNYIKTLANFRKHSSALTKGKMMEYVPDDGVFVYFRYDAQQTIMCIMNTNDKESEINTERFSERIKGFRKVKNVIDGSTKNIEATIKIPAMTEQVFEMQL